MEESSEEVGGRGVVEVDEQEEEEAVEDLELDRGRVEA